MAACADQVPCLVLEKVSAVPVLLVLVHAAHVSLVVLGRGCSCRLKYFERLGVAASALPWHRVALDVQVHAS